MADDDSSTSPQQQKPTVVAPPQLQPLPAIEETPPLPLPPTTTTTTTVTTPIHNMDHSSPVATTNTTPSSRDKGQLQYMKELQVDNASLHKQVYELKILLKRKDKEIERLKMLLEKAGMKDTGTPMTTTANKKGPDNDVSQNNDKKKKGPSTKKKKHHDNDHDDENDPMVPQSAVMEFLIQHGGLCRFTIFNDVWHSRNPLAANFLFGSKTWSSAKEELILKFPDLEPLQSPQLFKHYSKKRRKLTTIEMTPTLPWEHCMLVKLMDRTGLTADRTAFLYGKHPRTVTRFKQKWCPLLGLSKDSGYRSKQMIAPSSTGLHAGQKKGRLARKREREERERLEHEMTYKGRRKEDDQTTMEQQQQQEAAAVLAEGLGGVGNPQQQQGIGNDPTQASIWNAGTLL